MPFAPKSSVRSTLAVLTLLLVAAPARAQEVREVPQPTLPARDAGLILRMNFDFGGTKVAEVKLSDGSTNSVRAGQLFTVSTGL